MSALDGLVIVQPGTKLPTLDDYPGDFADWILAGMGVSDRQVAVLRPQKGDVLPDPQQVGAVVVTGSGAMVTDPDEWIGRVSAWLAAVVALDRPVLGICFGHQLLAHALGGVVGDNPRGVEVGSVVSRPGPAAADDRLFASWSGGVWVQASHRQSVWRLPEGAVSLAASDKDPHHAFRYGRQCWGVQFHPEFDRRVVMAYIDHYRGDLVRQGESAALLCRSSQETTQAASLLADFAQCLMD